MKQEALSHFTDLHLTVTGLVIFFAFFVSMVIWVNHKSNQARYKMMAQIPLDQGDQHE